MNSEQIRLGWRGWYFCALLPLGFGYVAWLLCGRALPFDPWPAWLGVTLSGPALFLLGAQHVLVPSADIRQAFLRIGVVYTLPFVAALHFQWIERTTGAHFALTGESMRRLTAADRVMMLIALGLFVAIGGVCVRQAWRRQNLWRYLLAFVAMIGVPALGAIFLAPAYRIHIHHYFLALILMPFVRFPHPLCASTHAFLAGLYVEGASRWGFDPIWELASAPK